MDQQHCWLPITSSLINSFLPAAVWGAEVSVQCTLVRTTERQRASCFLSTNMSCLVTNLDFWHTVTQVTDSCYVKAFTCGVACSAVLYVVNALFAKLSTILVCPRHTDLIGTICADPCYCFIALFWWPLTWALADWQTCPVCKIMTFLQNINFNSKERISQYWSMWAAARHVSPTTFGSVCSTTICPDTLAATTVLHPYHTANSPATCNSSDLAVLLISPVRLPSMYEYAYV